MKHLRKACEIAGSQRALAAMLGVTEQAVGLWFLRGVPKKRLVAVERATGGKVKASDLWAEKRGAA